MSYAMQYCCFFSGLKSGAVPELKETKLCGYLWGFVSIKQGEIVEDGCCPFKIVFDEGLYVVFDEDLFVHFICIVLSFKSVLGSA